MILFSDIKIISEIKCSEVYTLSIYITMKNIFLDITSNNIIIFFPEVLV